MRLSSRSSGTAAAVALAVATLANAARAEGPEFSFSGYGTVAATFADTHAAQFRASWLQSRGSQAQVDWGVDSRLGAQLNASFNDSFSATGQVLAQRLGSTEQLSMEWLYGQAQLGPDTVARLGRVVLTAFMLSDVRNVGYSQHWVRTPYEVYLTFPPVDGAQLLYRTTWEGFKFSVQPTIGQAKAEMFYELGPLGLTSAPTDFHKLLSLQLTAEKGDWTTRLSQTLADATIRWPSSLRPYEDLKYSFTSLGLQYDNGSLLAMAETMRGTTDNHHYDVAGRYITAGYRFGAWMPYATYSYLNNQGTRIDGVPDSHTAALGMRWDAVKDVALKGQAERSRLSGQQFIGVTPGTDIHGSATVYTLALDFVF